MDLWRLNFKPMSEGGDDVTGALRKVDLNFGSLNGALADTGEVGARLMRAEQVLAGLGNAAGRNVGTGIGSVAAGDDARIVAVSSKADKSYVDAGLAQKINVTNPVFDGAIGKKGVFGQTCFYVSNATGEQGIGGAFVDWSGSRTPAVQIDAMSRESAYMGFRWTRWGAKHLAGIDVYEGGSAANAMTSLNFHFDVGINRHAFYSNGNAVFAGTLAQNSDYRIKSDVVSIDLETAAVSLRRSRPVEYRDVRQAGDSKRLSGFIAHELQENFPLVVDGEKDATRVEPVVTGDATPYQAGQEPESWSAPQVESRNVPELQNVNYIGLVPYLCAGWQQLDRRIQDLEQKLASVMDRMAAMQAGVDV